MPVDTAKVTDRRQLKFNTLDDILADVERLKAGKVRSLGNWSPGQNLKHLEILMIGCLDGIEVKVSFLMRIAVSLLKGRVLTKPMSAGLQLPKAAAALLPAETSWEDGVQGICAALLRMKTEVHRHAHPVLGALTRDQWDQLHCRHCELHLSFLVPEAP
jgi:hypothetical protein